MRVVGLFVKWARQSHPALSCHVAVNGDTATWHEVREGHDAREEPGWHRAMLARFFVGVVFFAGIVPIAVGPCRCSIAQN
jgi:hypothetical protein